MNNQKNSRWLSLITIILLLANIVTLAILWSNRGEQSATAGTPAQPPVQPFEFISRELKLDQQQQDAYKKLRDQHQAIQRVMQDSIRKAKNEFYELLRQPQLPDSAIKAAGKKANDLVAEMDMITFKHFQQVRAICNTDQQQKFDEIIQEVLHRMGGPKRGPGPPPGEMPPHGREHDGPPPSPGQ